MPILQNGVTCPISGKQINEGDYYMRFPAFIYEDGDPEAICCEAPVIREEFETWRYKERAIKRVKQFYSKVAQTYSEHEHTLELDNEFYISENYAISTITIVLLNHVFLIHLQKSGLQKLGSHVFEVVNELYVKTFMDGTLHIKRAADSMKLCQSDNYWKDCIILPTTEWTRFQTAIRKAIESARI